MKLKSQVKKHEISIAETTSTAPSVNKQISAKTTLTPNPSITDLMPFCRALAQRFAGSNPPKIKPASTNSTEPDDSDSSTVSDLSVHGNEVLVYHTRRSREQANQASKKKKRRSTSKVQPLIKLTTPSPRARRASSRVGTAPTSPRRGSPTSRKTPTSNRATKNQDAFFPTTNLRDSFMRIGTVGDGRYGGLGGVNLELTIELKALLVQASISSLHLQQRISQFDVTLKLKPEKDQRDFLKKCINYIFEKAADRKKHHIETFATDSETDINEEPSTRANQLESNDHPEFSKFVSYLVERYLATAQPLTLSVLRVFNTSAIEEVVWTIKRNHYDLFDMVLNQFLQDITDLQKARSLLLQPDNVTLIRSILKACNEHGNNITVTRAFRTLINIGFFNPLDDDYNLATNDVLTFIFNECHIDFMDRDENQRSLCHDIAKSRHYELMFTVLNRINMPGIMISKVGRERFIHYENAQCYVLNAVDNSGKTPLDILQEQHAPNDIIEQLVQRYKAITCQQRTASLQNNSVVARYVSTSTTTSRKSTHLLGLSQYHPCLFAITSNIASTAKFYEHQPKGTDRNSTLNKFRAQTGGTMWLDSNAAQLTDEQIIRAKRYSSAPSAPTQKYR